MKLKDVKMNDLDRVDGVILWKFLTLVCFFYFYKRKSKPCRHGKCRYRGSTLIELDLKFYYVKLFFFLLRCYRCSAFYWTPKHLSWVIKKFCMCTFWVQVLYLHIWFISGYPKHLERLQSKLKVHLGREIETANTTWHDCEMATMALLQNDDKHAPTFDRATAKHIIATSVTYTGTQKQRTRRLAITCSGLWALMHGNSQSFK